MNFHFHITISQTPTTINNSANLHANPTIVNENRHLHARAGPHYDLQEGDDSGRNSKWYADIGSAYNAYDNRHPDHSVRNHRNYGHFSRVNTTYGHIPRGNSSYGHFLRGDNSYGHFPCDDNTYGHQTNQEAQYFRTCQVYKRQFHKNANKCPSGCSRYNY